MSTPEQMAESMKKNLKDKTGKSLAQWVKLAKASGLSKHGELVKYLKSEHDLTHGYANLVAHELRQTPAVASGDPVAAQYAGPKAALRPIYDALLESLKSFGDDVEIAPKKAYVSLRRNKQFALIQPSTQTRLDLGLNLKGLEPSGRLERSGSFNAMVTHRVKLSDVQQVDKQLLSWLKKAYDAG